MPSSAEHTVRIKQGLAFIADAQSATYPNNLVTEYFYTALHMLEATVFDHTAKPKKRHYFTHGDRTAFLSAARFDNSSPFFGIGADYEALRGLSEQARYLSPAGSETYEPLTASDVNQAQVLFTDIRKKFEAVYSKRKAPWA